MLKDVVHSSHEQITATIGVQVPFAIGIAVVRFQHKGIVGVDYKENIKYF